MVHVEATRNIKASPTTVWSFLADAPRWQDWSPMDETKLERPAPSGDPNGVGALRWLRTGRIISREEVVVYDAPHHFAYTLVSGLPLRDYRADVTLEETGGETVVRWKSAFLPKIPGTGFLYAFVLRRFLEQFLEALAKVASQTS
ncbi:MAG: SRPBCC family protein [Byssovorax sp.]